MKYNLRPILALAALWLVLYPAASLAQDLAEIQEVGVLRHLSIPYAHFDSGMGDGLDVEFIRMFASHLGVRYEYVRTDFSTVVGDLAGKRVRPSGQDVEILGDAEIKGDVAAHGFTVLPWRQKAVAFSAPTFPTQVWLVSPAASPYAPIQPSESLETDIAAARKIIPGTTVMGKAGTCLDLSLYGFEKDGATGINFEGSLNELTPALLAGESDLLILDVPDALVALNKWPGQIKILGPMSERQDMAAAFRHSSPELRAAFNDFLAACKQDGTYLALVRKYYPDVFTYYPEFFSDCR
jgi:ABC-type amino acid transport substrate-binding protein